MSGELVSTHDVEHLECSQPQEGDLMHEAGRGGKPRLRCHVREEDAHETVRVDYVDIEGGMEVSVGNKNVDMTAHIEPHQKETCAVVDRGDSMVLDCIEPDPEAYYG